MSSMFANRNLVTFTHPALSSCPEHSLFKTEQEYKQKAKGCREESVSELSMRRENLLCM